MIRAAPNAYAAKLVADEHLDKTRADGKDVNVQAMAYVVTRKLQSDGFVAAMAATDGKPIVEISTRDAFWGAKPNGKQLTGQNVLGAILDHSYAGARENELQRGTAFSTTEQATALVASAAGNHSANT